MTHHIYLDANATTPVLPKAAESALRAMRENFGNPSSTHTAGLQARHLMGSVRALASRQLGAGNGELLFVSGATEAIQTSVLSALCDVGERRERGEAVGTLLLYGATEHKAVPESLAHWNRLLRLDLELRALPVDANGEHDLAALRAMAPMAAMLCTMAANNETGCVSNLGAISQILEETRSSALWLVDCVQALGKLPVDLAAARIDYAAFSGHKLYAPKGIGLLYVRTGAPFTPLMAGGGQEHGLRSGTENMAGIAAFGAVLEALEDGHTFRSHDTLVCMRDRLARSLTDAFPGLVFNVPLDKSLPTTLNFSVPELASKELLDLFDAAGVRVSSGSACSAAKAAPSYVLEAMRLPAWQTASAIRMSFGPATDEAFIDSACAAIGACGAALRASRTELAAEAEHGVVQFSAQGMRSWLLVDAPSASCVIIDPLPAVQERLACYIQARAYRVLAIVGTQADAPFGQARTKLAQRLGLPVAPDAGYRDATGWPSDGSRATLLPDGRSCPALRLGRATLVRVDHAGQSSYLLGETQADGMAADAMRFAFVASASTSDSAIDVDHALAPLVGPRVLLCSSHDDRDVPARMLVRTLARGPDATDPVHADLGSADLHDDTFASFLHLHTDALLVDVREPQERELGGLPVKAGYEMLHVPTSRLVNQLGHWLADKQRPLVFICRSGNRSSKVAACLRRFGYANAWHLAGGLALAPDSRTHHPTSVS